MKTERINIYITADEKKQLIQVKNRYKISISTIAQIVYKWYGTCLEKTLESNYIEYLTEQDKNEKTSIKPRKKLDDLPCNYQERKRNWSMIYTNCLKIYIHKSFKQYFKQENNQASQQLVEEMNAKIHGSIAKQMQETRDAFYTYNDTLRNNIRAIRENPKLFEKVGKK